MKLDPKKTALLTLDFQNGIIGMVAGSDACVQSASKIVQYARKAGVQIIHVGLGFAKGHPEIPDTQVIFKRIKENNLFVIGTPTAEFHKDLTQPEDLVVYKHRVSGFTENQLHLILRSKGIENLILMGIATSGIVLSTIRAAFDLDFNCTVISDACFDSDEEVHRVLTEKVFPRQGTVMTADAFIQEQA
jgi:nicotinamidase-related amidase